MINWQDEFLILLRQYYSSQRNKNPRYSMRALAQQLGTAPGPTSALLKGSKVWNISPEWAIGVLDKMNVKLSKKNRIRVLIGETPIVTTKSIPQKIDGLAVSHWAYWPILVYFEMKPRTSEPEPIAKKLGISVAQVSNIIADLLQRGFLLKDSDGNLQRCSEALESANDILSLAAKNMHRDNLEVAKRSLEIVPTSAREFQTLTVAGSSSMINEIKQEIRTFTDRMAWLLNKEDENDTIYRFSIQLFPVNFGEYEK